MNEVASYSIDNRMFSNEKLCSDYNQNILALPSNPFSRAIPNGQSYFQSVHWTFSAIDMEQSDREGKCFQHFSKSYWVIGTTLCAKLKCSISFGYIHFDEGKKKSLLSMEKVIPYAKWLPLSKYCGSHPDSYNAVAFCKKKGTFCVFESKYLCNAPKYSSRQHKHYELSKTSNETLVSLPCEPIAVASSSCINNGPNNGPIGPSGPTNFLGPCLSESLSTAELTIQPSIVEEFQSIENSRTRCGIPLISSSSTISSSDDTIVDDSISDGELNSQSSSLDEDPSSSDSIIVETNTDVRILSEVSSSEESSLEEINNSTVVDAIANVDQSDNSISSFIPFANFVAKCNTNVDFNHNKVVANSIGKYCGQNYSSWNNAKKALLSVFPEYLEYFPCRIRKIFNIYYNQHYDSDTEESVIRSKAKILCKRYR